MFTKEYKLYTKAIAQKEDEFDLMNIIEISRKGNFLNKMQEDPDKVSLAKYSREYRIEA